MANYIEFREDEEPKREEPKRDVHYAEPAQSETESPDETPQEREGQTKTGGAFVLNGGGFKQPKTLVFVAVVSGLAAAFVLSKLWTREAQVARIVAQGNRLQKTEEIERALSKFIGKKMSDVSLAEVVETLSALPYVRKAIATKELPDAIRARIEERQPVAMAIVGGSLKLIDEEGYAMNKSDVALESARLPLLTGFSKVGRDSVSGLAKLDSAETSIALSFCAALRETELARLVIGEVRVVSPNRLDAFAPEGEARFVFGKGDYERQLERFEIFWTRVVVKRGVKPFEYVDARFDGKIFAKEFEPANPKRKPQN